MADERAVSGLPGQKTALRVGASDQGNSPWREDAHAVVIGIDVYRDPHIPNLRYARTDAEAVYRVLTDPNVGRFNPANVVLLADSDATERRIKSEIGTKLPQRASTRSTVCIYYAGHGAPAAEANPARHRPDGLERFLVPHDGEADDLQASAISMDRIQEWFSRIDANQLVCFLDTCYSGAAGGRTFGGGMFRAAGVPTKESEQFLDALAGEGHLVITACSPNQVSIENPDKGHGLFTYHLVRGLEGRADTDRDGRVSVDELYRYVYDRVERDSRLMQGRMTPLRKGTVRGTVYLTYPRSAESAREAEGGSVIASAVVPKALGSTETTHQTTGSWRRVAVATSSIAAVTLVIALWLWNRTTPEIERRPTPSPTASTSAAPTPVVVEDVSPRDAERGGRVVVTGRDLGALNARVNVGAVPAQVVGGDATHVVFRVPMGAVLGETTVSISNAAGQSGTFAFRVRGPTIVPVPTPIPPARVPPPFTGATI